MSEANMNWFQICQIQDIPSVGARVIEGAKAGPIAIFRAEDDAVFAVLDRCPHKGGPLSQGIVHGHTVTCPLHSWNIGLSDGCAKAPDEGCARRYSVKVEGSDVLMSKTEIEEA